MAAKINFTVESILAVPEMSVLMVNGNSNECVDG